jgi:hypothetical protein
MATVIKIIDETLSIKVQLDLTDNHTILALFAATGGNPSDIEQLLKVNIFHCIKSNQRTLELEQVIQGYESLRLPYGFCGDDSAFDFSTDELLEIIDSRSYG